MCLKVWVDVKSSDAGLTVPLGVTTVGGDLRYVMMNGGNIEVENGPQIMAYEAGKWYNITAYFDFTTKTYDIVVTDGQNSTENRSEETAYTCQEKGMRIRESFIRKGRNASFVICTNQLLQRVHSISWGLAVCWCVC